MKIARLRLLGFKSFVEPTELIIEPGLTGVVGPNGCGKSNLLEALRWVMGETSYKSMRAASMDDVIFSGTTQRPARNAAEVTIFVDNRERLAPAEFNETESIEISRHIERESGSNYRVNGKEVRARDVRILFEDAATGARSPALVRQGQISEIVNAKPEQRRRVLEDAAGIAGLHSRRHEAELRLKAAQGNLDRLDDVLGQLGAQMDSLKRQARQARRYKDISGDIRRAEAIVLHLTWQEAHDLVLSEEGALGEALATLGLATEGEARALRAEAEANAAMQPLRDEEAERAASVARLKVEQANLDREAEAARTRTVELQQRMQQIHADLARENERLEQTGETLDGLMAERQKLVDAEAALQSECEALRSQVGACQLGVAEAEQHYATVSQAAISVQAERSSHIQRKEEYEERKRHVAAKLATLEGARRDLAAEAPDLGGLERLRLDVGGSEQVLTTLQEQIAEAEVWVQDARALSTERREASRVTEMHAQQLRTEILTLEKLLTPALEEAYPPVLDQMQVTPGCEAAVAAAFGDDLDASLDPEAPQRWQELNAAQDQATLPPETQPLANFVSAPAALGRRLAHIALVAREDGDRLQALLVPGPAARLT